MVKRPSPQRPGRSKGPTAPGRAIKPAAAFSKPFSMSLDGMTEAQYIRCSVRPWSTDELVDT